MDLPDLVPDRPTLLRAVPVTVAVVAGLCWVLAAVGIRFEDVFPIHPLNPFVYLASGLFHSDWGHFAGNMRLWIPFGVALTWLTSNRHVLLVAVAAQVLTSVVGMAIGRVGIGLSSVVLAVAAATLVRSTGMAVGSASTETLQTVVLGVLAPLVLGFFLVAVLAGGGTTIAHFSHFFGFLFGGAIEAMYVLTEYSEDDSGGREIPRRIGR